jgi:hypothetical protein
MKLRRLMQRPSRAQPTKGQRCASQQNWPAYVRFGSFTTDAVEATRACMSASPLKADNGQTSGQVHLVPRTAKWTEANNIVGCRQCLNALCPEFRFGHGGLSRFGFESCHGSSGAVRTVSVLAGAALVQSPVVSLIDGG